MTKKPNFVKLVDLIYKKLNLLSKNQSELNDMVLKLFPRFKLEDEPRFTFRKLVTDKLAKCNVAKPMFSKLSSIITESYPNPNTRKGIYVEWRKVINERFGKTNEFTLLADKEFQLTKVESEVIDEKQEQALEDKHSNPLVFGTPDLIRKIAELRDSNSLESKVILVAMTTGARLIEILHQGKFEEDSPPYIIVSGLAKRRHNKDGSVERPLLLIKYRELIDTIDQIRREVATRNTPPDKLSGYWDGRINRFLRRLFGRQDIKLHDMRRVYAALSFKLYAPKDVSFNLWIKNVLGHESLGVSVAYQSIQLTDDPIEPEPSLGSHVNVHGVMIRKLERRKLSDGEHMLRIGRKIDEMRGKGIEPTAPILRSIGIGATLAKTAMENYNLSVNSKRK